MFCASSPSAGSFSFHACVAETISICLFLRITQPALSVPVNAWNVGKARAFSSLKALHIG